MGAAETSEGVDVSRAHSAVVKAPMARRECILVFVCDRVQSCMDSVQAVDGGCQSAAGADKGGGGL